jgi:polymorphic toxin system nucleotidyltransferase-like protein
MSARHMNRASIHEQFNAALDGVIALVKEDRTILAALLCGSLAHDVVWEKSDIDLVLITVDDKLGDENGLSLNAEGLNIHAVLIPRAEFRRAAEGTVRNSFMHSFLAKGRLLYTHDPTIADICARLQTIGSRDTLLQLLQAAAAHKWFVTRGDLDYTALWILYAATPLAKVEVFGRRLLADREVIPQALALNPAFFKTIYTDLLNAKKTRPGVRAALDAVDAYMADRARTAFAPVLEHLREVGEPRSSRELEHHFSRTLNVTGVDAACEYLADQGIIGKASSPARLTKRSNVQVQELAFYSIEPPADAF